jgi:hypothetical protein
MASNTETACTTVILDGKQAGEELKELKLKAKNLRAELKELKIAGDSSVYEAKKRELDGRKRSMGQAKKPTYDFDQLMKNLSGSSLKELVRSQNTLQAEISNSTPNTPEEVGALKAKESQPKKLKLAHAHIPSKRSEC